MTDEDPAGFWAGKFGSYLRMPEEEKLELATALYRREEEARFRLGIVRLRQRHPAAPEVLVGAGAYNLYGHLASAFIDLLAYIELNLRDPEYEINEAVLHESAYHLYSWIQIEALLPWADRDFQEELQDVKERLEGGDTEGAREMIDKLLERVGGDTPPPIADADR